MQIKKILIIRFSSIGDIVLTSPVIRCIKKQMPETEIHYLTKKSFSILVESNPYIDKIHLLDDNLSKTLKDLESENFDFIIDLHNNIRTFKIKWHLEKPVRSFNKINIRKWLLVNFKLNILPEKHIVQRYLEAARRLKVFDDGEGLDYFIPQKDEIKLSDFPLTHLHGYAALVIGAQHYTKKLPLIKLKELCEKIQIPVIVIGGIEDSVIGNELEKLFPYKVFNACGKFNLNQSASIIRQSKIVITNDTSMMHIAAAFKKIIHSFWGNTIPKFGMQPYFGSNAKYQALYKSNSFLHEAKKVNCRPCSKIGFQKCPKGHFDCMMKQNFDTLLNELPKN